MKDLTRRAITFTLVSALVFSSVAPPCAEARQWTSQRSSLRSRPGLNRTPESNPLFLLNNTSPFGRIQGRGPQRNFSAGQVEETFWVDPAQGFAPTWPGETQPPVIIIQDLHGNLEAQTNLAHIVHDIARQQLDRGNKNPLTLAVEGAWEPLETEWLRLLPDRDKRDAVMTQWLKEGFLSGEEFLAVTADDIRLELLGIDDRALHGKNTQAQTECRRLEPQALNTIDSLFKAAETLEHRLSPSQKNVLSVFKKHGGDSLPFPEYLSQLKAHWPGPWPAERFPRTTTFLHHYGEILTWAKKSDRSLSPLTLTSQWKENFSLSPLGGLLEETPRLVLDLEKTLLGLDSGRGQYTPQQKAFLFSHWLLLSKPLIQLKMTPQEWSTYKELRQYLTPSDVDLKTVGLFPPHQAKLPLSLLWHVVSEAESFYTLAEQRDHAMGQNLNKVLSRKGSTPTLLIVGGFHRQGLTRRLRLTGHPYAVLSPNFTHPSFQAPKGPASLSAFHLRQASHLSDLASVWDKLGRAFTRREILLSLTKSSPVKLITTLWVKVKFHSNWVVNQMTGIDSALKLLNPLSPAIPHPAQLANPNLYLSWIAFLVIALPIALWAVTILSADFSPLWQIFSVSPALPPLSVVTTSPVTASLGDPLALSGVWALGMLLVSRLDLGAPLIDILKSMNRPPEKGTPPPPPAPHREPLLTWTYQFRRAVEHWENDLDFNRKSIRLNNISKLLDAASARHPLYAGQMFYAIVDGSFHNPYEMFYWMDSKLPSETIAHHLAKALFQTRPDTLGRTFTGLAQLLEQKYVQAIEEKLPLDESFAESRRTFINKIDGELTKLTEQGMTPPFRTPNENNLNAYISNPENYFQSSGGSALFLDVVSMTTTNHLLSQFVRNNAQGPTEKSLKGAFEASTVAALRSTRSPMGATTLIFPTQSVTSNRALSPVVKKLARPGKHLMSLSLPHSLKKTTLETIAGLGRAEETLGDAHQVVVIHLTQLIAENPDRGIDFVKQRLTDLNEKGLPRTLVIDLDMIEDDYYPYSNLGGVLSEILDHWNDISRDPGTTPFNLFFVGTPRAGDRFRTVLQTHGAELLDLRPNQAERDPGAQFSEMDELLDDLWKKTSLLPYDAEDLFMKLYDILSSGLIDHLSSENKIRFLTSLIPELEDLPTVERAAGLIRSINLNPTAIKNGNAFATEVRKLISAVASTTSDIGTNRTTKIRRLQAIVEIYEPILKPPVLPALPTSVELKIFLDPRLGGLEEVKDRIQELRAHMENQRKSADTTLPYMLFAGPPGTGKTFTPQLMAEALGFYLCVIPCGGLKDDRVLTGHLETYVGSVEGVIAKAKRDAKGKPVLYLFDELDKAAPSILTVVSNITDKNVGFKDLFINLPLDFSKDLIIVTSNEVDRLPDWLISRVGKPLLFQGYSKGEKKRILQEIILPKLIGKLAISHEELEIPDVEGLLDLVISLSPGPGLRSAENILKAILTESVFPGSTPINKRIFSIDSIRHQFPGMASPPSTSPQTRRQQVGWAKVTATSGRTASVHVWGKSESNESPGVIEIPKSWTDSRKETQGSKGQFALPSASAARLADQIISDPGTKGGYRHFGIDIFPDQSICGPEIGLGIALAKLSVMENSTIPQNFGAMGEFDTDHSLKAHPNNSGELRTALLGFHEASLRGIVLPQPNRNDLINIFRQHPDDGLSGPILEWVDGAINISVVGSNGFNPHSLNLARAEWKWDNRNNIWTALAPLSELNSLIDILGSSSFPHLYFCVSTIDEAKQVAFHKLPDDYSQENKTASPTPFIFPETPQTIDEKTKPKEKSTSVPQIPHPWQADLHISGHTITWEDLTTRPREVWKALLTHLTGMTPDALQSSAPQDLNRLIAHLLTHDPGVFPDATLLTNEALRKWMESSVSSDLWGNILTLSSNPEWAELTPLLNLVTQLLGYDQNLGLDYDNLLKAQRLFDERIAPCTRTKAKYPHLFQALDTHVRFLEQTRTGSLGVQAKANSALKIRFTELNKHLPEIKNMLEVIINSLHSEPSGDSSHAPGLVPAPVVQAKTPEDMFPNKKVLPLSHTLSDAARSAMWFLDNKDLFKIQSYSNTHRIPKRIRESVGAYLSLIFGVSSHQQLFLSVPSPEVKDYLASSWISSIAKESYLPFEVITPIINRLGSNLPSRQLGLTQLITHASRARQRLIIIDLDNANTFLGNSAIPTLQLVSDLAHQHQLPIVFMGTETTLNQYREHRPGVFSTRVLPLTLTPEDSEWGEWLKSLHPNAARLSDNQMALLKTHAEESLSVAYDILHSWHTGDDFSTHVKTYHEQQQHLLSDRVLRLLPRMPTSIAKEAREALGQIANLNSESAERANIENWLTHLADFYNTAGQFSLGNLSRGGWGKFFEKLRSHFRSHAFFQEGSPYEAYAKAMMLQISLALRQKYLGATLHPNVIAAEGPPGTGKSTLAQYLDDGESPGKVQTIQASDLHRGFGRGYQGSQPSEPAKARMRAGCEDFTLIIDEIDKIADLPSEQREEKIGILLELLDPEQNKNFHDHHLGKIDLSKVRIIVTANDLSRVPPELNSRLQVITVPGYTLGNKVTIAKNFSLPKFLKYYLPPAFSERDVLEVEAFKRAYHGLTLQFASLPPLPSSLSNSKEVVSFLNDKVLTDEESIKIFSNLSNHKKHSRINAVRGLIKQFGPFLQEPFYTLADVDFILEEGATARNHDDEIEAYLKVLLDSDDSEGARILQDRLQRAILDALILKEEMGDTSGRLQLRFDRAAKLYPRGSEGTLTKRGGAPEVGIAHGLSHGKSGGEALRVSAFFRPGPVRSPHKPEIISPIGGNTGEDVEESANHALDFLWRYLSENNLSRDKTYPTKISITYPAPWKAKSGPSAGALHVAVLASLLLDKPIPNDVALTGACYSDGTIKRVGGIAEGKFFAAIRNGQHTLFVPKENIPDIQKAMAENAHLDSIVEDRTGPEVTQSFRLRFNEFREEAPGTWDKKIELLTTILRSKAGSDLILIPDPQGITIKGSPDKLAEFFSKKDAINFALIEENLSTKITKPLNTVVLVDHGSQIIDRLFFDRVPSTPDPDPDPSAVSPTPLDDPKAAKPATEGWKGLWNYRSTLSVVSLAISVLSVTALGAMGGTNQWAPLLDSGAGALSWWMGPASLIVFALGVIGMWMVFHRNGRKKQISSVKDSGNELEAPPLSILKQDIFHFLKRARAA